MIIEARESAERAEEEYQLSLKLAIRWPEPTDDSEADDELHDDLEDG